eukprot:Selendium_serpulae@DN2934_c0_g1_i1.p1
MHSRNEGRPKTTRTQEQRHGTKDTTQCRKCGALETTAHVLNHCSAHHDHITARHDRACNRIIEALTKHLDLRTTSITTNRYISPTAPHIKPDITIHNTNTNTFTLIDLCITHEDRRNTTLQLARDRKDHHYQELSTFLQQQHNATVTIAPIVYGTYGAIDETNISLLNKAGIPARYAKKMQHYLTIDVIRDNVAIWQHHSRP